MSRSIKKGPFVAPELYKRVEELKKEFPKVHAVDPDDVRVIYVITDDPDKYAEHVGA